ISTFPDTSEFTVQKCQKGKDLKTQCVCPQKPSVLKETMKKKKKSE
ncbi:hypothetical protein K5549_021318, partial [Capra hircus]